MGEIPLDATKQDNQESKITSESIQTEIDNDIASGKITGEKLKRLIGLQEKIKILTDAKANEKVKISDITKTNLDILIKYSGEEILKNGFTINKKEDFTILDKIISNLGMSGNFKDIITQGITSKSLPKNTEQPLVITLDLKDKTFSIYKGGTWGERIGIVQNGKVEKDSWSGIDRNLTGNDDQVDIDKTEYESKKPKITSAIKEEESSKPIAPVKPVVKPIKPIDKPIIEPAVIEPVATGKNLVIENTEKQAIKTLILKNGVLAEDGQILKIKGKNINFRIEGEGEDKNTLFEETKLSTKDSVTLDLSRSIYSMKGNDGKLHDMIPVKLGKELGYISKEYLLQSGYKQTKSKVEEAKKSKKQTATISTTEKTLKSDVAPKIENTENVENITKPKGSVKSLNENGENYNAKNIEKLKNIGIINSQIGADGKLSFILPKEAINIKFTNGTYDGVFNMDPTDRIVNVKNDSGTITINLIDKDGTPDTLKYTIPKIEAKKDNAVDGIEITERNKTTQEILRKVLNEYDGKSKFNGQTIISMELIQTGLTRSITIDPKISSISVIECKILTEDKKENIRTISLHDISNQSNEGKESYIRRQIKEAFKNDTLEMLKNPTSKESGKEKILDFNPEGIDKLESDLRKRGISDVEFKPDGIIFPKDKYIIKINQGTDSVGFSNSGIKRTYKSLGVYQNEKIFDEPNTSKAVKIENIYSGRMGMNGICRFDIKYEDGSILQLEVYKK